ncbi:DMT family transporter [Roseibium aquae]|nr:DMT family transporter [Roseibium aquae]
MSDHVKGLLLTSAGVLLVVPDSLFVRLIDGDPIVTAFWRALFSGVIILAGVWFLMGANGFKAVFRTGWRGWLYICLMGSTAPGFVLAVSNTSVANVVFILASMPVFAVLFSRIFLKEPITRRMTLTIAAVLVGLGVLALGSHTQAAASWKGDLWALYVSVVFAGALTLVRQLKSVSMVPALPIAFLGTALALAPFGAPLATFAMDWPLYLAHGGFIGVSACLLALGPRYILPAEAALLILLESILAPLLVWAVLGEDPGGYPLLGGTIVIGTLIVSNMIALRRPAYP